MHIVQIKSSLWVTFFICVRIYLYLHEILFIGNLKSNKNWALQGLFCKDSRVHLYWSE